MSKILSIKFSPGDTPPSKTLFSIDMTIETVELSSLPVTTIHPNVIIIGNNGGYFRRIIVRFLNAYFKKYVREYNQDFVRNPKNREVDLPKTNTRKTPTKPDNQKNIKKTSGNTRSKIQTRNPKKKV